MYLVVKKLAVLGFLLTIPVAGAQPVAPRRAYTATVQSLTTYAYQQANVIFAKDRATIQFTNGRQLVVTLESTRSDDEEMLGRDERDQYWAIYVDWISGEPSPTKPIVTRSRALSATAS